MRPVIRIRKVGVVCNETVPDVVLKISDFFLWWLHGHPLVHIRTTHVVLQISHKKLTWAHDFQVQRNIYDAWRTLIVSNE